MSSAISLFNKLTSLCERNSILTLEKKADVILKIKYGPLGYLLKHNIQNEWLKFFVTHTEAEIFPTTLQSFNTAFRSNSCDVSLPFGIEDQYKLTLPLISKHLPFGIAITDDQVLNTDEEPACNSTQNIIWRLKFRSLRTLAFFCNPKKVMYWFHYWQRQRYIWWRKFSNVPSQFSLKSDTSDSNDHCVQIQYEYPWGMQNIETIKVFNESQLLQKFNNLSDVQNSESVIPSLVLCETSLDEAVFMYLSNSFEEKWLQGKLKTILRLHHKFCPYKVSILVKTFDSNLKEKLSNISHRLTKQLKQKGVAVFPSFSEKAHCSIDLQIEWLDEMGIPYIIVLTEGLVITGIAGLRSRDTTLEEQVHITELTSKILSYLLMNKDKSS